MQPLNKDFVIYSIECFADTKNGPYSERSPIYNPIDVKEEA